MSLVSPLLRVAVLLDRLAALSDQGEEREGQ